MKKTWKKKSRDRGPQYKKQVTNLHSYTLYESVISLVKEEERRERGEYLEMCKSWTISEI